MRKIAISATILAMLAGGCSEQSQQIPSAGNTENSSKNSTCSTSIIEKSKIDQISIQDALDACKVMKDGLGHEPSAKLSEMFQKMLVGYKHFGFKEDSHNISVQVIEIVKLRGKADKSDEEIISTMNAVYKCYQGSNGISTPKAFVAALSAMPKEQAEGLSDDFMYTLGALIQNNISPQ